MSVNAPQFYAQQYATNIQLLLQQRGSILRDCVLTGSHVGKAAQPVDQIGAIVAQKVTGRFQPMGRVDAVLDSRWVYPVDYDLPQLFDMYDRLRLLVDPTSSYVENAVLAMGRAMDDEIIAAFTGTSKTGIDGGTSTTLPSGQKVAVNFGASADVGLTVAKLREALRILRANQVQLNVDPVYCIVKAKQMDNLLAEAQVINRDYNGAAVLENGIVTRFLGINIVHDERLGTDGTDTDADVISVYAKSGMYLGMWQDVQADISQRKDLQGLPWQAYAYGTFGATRLEEKKLVQILCE